MIVPMPDVCFVCDEDAYIVYLQNPMLGICKQHRYLIDGKHDQELEKAIADWKKIARE